MRAARSKDRDTGAHGEVDRGKRHVLRGDRRGEDEGHQEQPGPVLAAGRAVGLLLRRRARAEPERRRRDGEPRRLVAQRVEDGILGYGGLPAPNSKKDPEVSLEKRQGTYSKLIFFRFWIR